MEKPIIIPKGCFWVEEKKMFYMQRCPKCKMENYTPNVASGICAWCGWNVNKVENDEKTNKNRKTD